VLQPSAASAASDNKDSFFRTSNPVFLGIFALVVVIAGVAASKLIFRDQPLLPGGKVGSGSGENRNKNEVEISTKHSSDNTDKKNRRSSRDSSGKTSSTASRLGSDGKKKKRRSSAEKYTSKVDPVQMFDENAERDEDAIKAKIRADFSPAHSPETSRELAEMHNGGVAVADVAETPVLLSPVQSMEPSAARENVTSVARSEASDIKMVSLKKAHLEKGKGGEDSSGSDSSDSEA
jgi:hypothetical protein